MKRNLYIFLLKSIIRKDFFILENSLIDRSNMLKLNLSSNKILKQFALDVFLLHFELVRFVHLCYSFNKIESFKFILKFHETFSTTFLKSYLVHSEKNSILFPKNIYTFKNFHFSPNFALITSLPITEFSLSLKPKFLFCNELKLIRAQSNYLVRNVLNTNKKLLFLLALLELSIDLKKTCTFSRNECNIKSSSYLNRKYRIKKKYNVKFL